MLKQIVILIVSFSFISNSFLFANDIEDIIHQLRAIKECNSNGGINNYEGLPLKSGTRFTMALSNIRDEIDPVLYKTLYDRPELSDTFGTEHFIIHYDVVGSNTVPSIDVNPSNGVPDYVDSTALICEYVWHFEIDTLGFIEPVSDGGGGGDNRYDIYLKNIGSQGYYGITYPETLQHGGRTYSSFIVLDNDYAEFWDLGYDENPMAAVKVTAAHEFFHAIQFSIDAYESENQKNWWYEVSSVWMEDIVFTEVNDYRYYLKYFFHYPWYTLESFSHSYADPVRFMHPYASCVWARFLHERFDRDVLRQIWKICGEVPGYNTLQATDQVLNNYGSSFEEAFVEFTSWNYFTCHRADTVNKYSEADQWINLLTNIPDTIRHRFFTNIDPFDYLNEPNGNPFDIYYTSEDNTPEPLSANYLAFNTYSSSGIYPGDLFFEFDGDDISAVGDEWRLAMLGWDSEQDTLIQVDINQTNSQGTGIFYDWDHFDYIVVIPSIVGYTYDDSSIGYSFEAYYNPLATSVWPGDLDYNGVVEAADILPLAEFWYEAGYPRDSISYDWYGFDADLWPIPAATYADADGSGYVNIRDFAAICLNWGLTHEGLLSVTDNSNFNIESHRDVLELLYAKVKDFETGPQYEIRLFLEGLLDIPLPNSFALYQNYPNPFNLSTCISYELPKKDNISISIYNIAGQLVKTYNCGIQESGIHSLVWDGCNESGDEITSGLYFYKLKSSENIKTKKMVMLK